MTWIACAQSVNSHRRAGSGFYQLVPSPEICPKEVRAQPLGVFCLGAKAPRLATAGFRTVGELADAGPARLARISSIGPKTVRKVQQHLEKLSRVSDFDTNIQANFAAELEMPLSPVKPVESGADMPRAITEVVEDVARVLTHASDVAILRLRQTRVPKERVTLDALSREARPVLTRERIRQRERNLIKALSDAWILATGGSVPAPVSPRICCPVAGCVCGMAG